MEIKKQIQLEQQKLDNLIQKGLSCKKTIKTILILKKLWKKE